MGMRAGLIHITTTSLGTKRGKERSSLLTVSQSHTDASPDSCIANNIGIRWTSIRGWWNRGRSRVGNYAKSKTIVLHGLLRKYYLIFVG